MDHSGKRDGIILLIGIVIGIILTVLVSGSDDRYSLLSSQDGSVVHKIDNRTGRVWWKNSYVEMDAQGQPVTIWYWEELTLDKPGASTIARDLQESTSQTRLAAEEAQRAEADKQAKLRQTRLDKIYAICGEDTDCVSEKCADGQKGSSDASWTSYCTQSLKSRIFDAVIAQCKGAPGCIKTYCINKYDNTYPAVSDCVSEINLRKVQSEAVRQETPPE